MNDAYRTFTLVLYWSTEQFFRIYLDNLFDRCCQCILRMSSFLLLYTIYVRKNSLKT
jgi:hypothetical protein